MPSSKNSQGSRTHTCVVQIFSDLASAVASAVGIWLVLNNARRKKGKENGYATQNFDCGAPRYKCYCAARWLGCWESDSQTAHCAHCKRSYTDPYTAAR